MIALVICYMTMMVPFFSIKIQRYNDYLYIELWSQAFLKLSVIVMTELKYLSFFA